MSRSRRCAARRRHLHRSTSTRAAQEHHQRCFRRLRARPRRPTASDRLSGARQRQRQAVPARSRHAARRRSSRSARTTTARRSSWTPTRSSSRRRRSIPTQPITPEVAKNGNIYNVWTLDLKNGELRQYTDALGGNVSPVPLPDGASGEGRVRHLLQGRLRHPHAAAEGTARHGGHSDFGAPGPIIDFQPPLSHTLVKENEQQEGHVREAVPRGPAAGQRRRHEQRRLLRRHA